MLWQTLVDAGWVGEIATLHMTVALRAGVSPPVSDIRERSRSELLPGRHRRLVERGWLDDRRVAWGLLIGPLNGRAAGPGYRLLENKHTPDNLEFGEDLLYTLAVQVGWLTGEQDAVIDVPDVQITVCVARRGSTAPSRSNHRSWSRRPGFRFRRKPAVQADQTVASASGA